MCRVGKVLGVCSTGFYASLEIIYIGHIGLEKTKMDEKIFEIIVVGYKQLIE